MDNFLSILVLYFGSFYISL